MPSNREAYFEALKLDIPKSIIEFALKEVNGFSNVELTKRFDEEIKDYVFFKNAIQRYINGEMMEYVFNKAYFLSTPFFVNKDVLIPRQETEQLVLRTLENTQEMFTEEIINIADVCTGSGCIGISIAKAFPNNHYYLTDISKEALRVADNNLSLLNNVDIKCLRGDMLEPLKNIKVDVIVCNPPYISNIKEIDQKTWKEEPHLALVAEPSTLFYEKVLKEYSSIVNKKWLIAFEIGEDMKEQLSDLVIKYCPNASYFFENDIYGKTRFLFIKQLGI